MTFGKKTCLCQAIIYCSGNKQHIKQCLCVVCVCVRVCVRAHYCVCGVVASVWKDSMACYDMVVGHKPLFSSDIDCN